MHSYGFEILTALSLRCGGVVFSVEIDEEARCARIVQKGQPLNGESSSLTDAVKTLAGRLHRTRPDLRLEEPG